MIVSLPGDLGKPRPAVIVQTDILNDVLRTVLLCPISSFSSNPILFRVPLEPTLENGLRLPSEIMVEKLQSANHSKVDKVIGKLSQSDLRRLARSLAIVLELAVGE